MGLNPEGMDINRYEELIDPYRILAYHTQGKLSMIACYERMAESARRSQITAEDLTTLINV